MSKKWLILIGVLAIVLATLACGGAAPRRGLDLYPSPTGNATQTPLVVIWTSTLGATPTPLIVEVTPTPNSGRLCVNAAVAVHLRPSPNDQNYPIMVIPNGTEIADLGGRSGKWLFVELGDKQGWVHGEYVRRCN